MAYDALPEYSRVLKTIEAVRERGIKAEYAYSSQNVIWVAGAQKITPSLEDAIRRIREHSLPTEDQNAKNAGAPGSFIGKLLIFEREAAYLKRNVVLLIVNEVLGV
jgi:hypothetical protein